MLPWWLWGRERGIPEVGCWRPFQSQAGNVHSSVHQQKENGHNAGDGVELPWEENQLEEEKEGINIHSNNRLLNDIQLAP